MRCATALFGPAPWGPGEGPKGQILLDIIKFQLQGQFQNFLNQTLCDYSQMKDKKHQTGFLFDRLGNAPGVGLGGTVGGGGGLGCQFFLKSTQSWCVSYLHEWHMQQHIFWVPRPLGPWEGAKGQI